VPLTEKHFIILFCDLKKAFDPCNHEILSKKLSKIGIRGTELLCFNSYLTNRQHDSLLLDILTGVTQGSILGLLLFFTTVGAKSIFSTKIQCLFQCNFKALRIELGIGRQMSLETGQDYEDLLDTDVLGMDKFEAANGSDSSGIPQNYVKFLKKHFPDSRINPSKFTPV
jgi:hypothetical protein